MTIKLLTVSLVLTALLVKPQAVIAQATAGPIRGSWESLKLVPPGDELVVSLRNGRTASGRLSGVSDAMLTLAVGKQTVDVSRGEVLRVHRLVSKSAKRSTFIGLGIGAGVGGLAGGIAAASGPGESGEYGWGVLIYGAIGIGVGSLVGYIIGSRKHRVLIYEFR